MNLREIELIEARLPLGLKPMSTEMELIGLVARARRERSQGIARLFGRFLSRLADAVVQIRLLASDCTAARRRVQHS